MQDLAGWILMASGVHLLAHRGGACSSPFESRPTFGQRLPAGDLVPRCFGATWAWHRATVADTEEAYGVVVIVLLASVFLASIITLWWRDLRPRAGARRAARKLGIPMRIACGLLGLSGTFMGIVVIFMENVTKPVLFGMPLLRALLIYCAVTGTDPSSRRDPGPPRDDGLPPEENTS